MNLSTKSVDNPVISLSQTYPVAHQLRAGVKLIKNWSPLKPEVLNPPETIDEAVDRLMMIIEDEYKQSIAAMPEYDLLDLHFTLGMAIRNAFGLHAPGSKLLASCGATHPDDAAGIIIMELWYQLKSMEY